jgi:hypothetical protein
MESQGSSGAFCVMQQNMVDKGRSVAVRYRLDESLVSGVYEAISSSNNGSVTGVDSRRRVYCLAPLDDTSSLITTCPSSNKAKKITHVSETVVIVDREEDEEVDQIC